MSSLIFAEEELFLEDIRNYAKHFGVYEKFAVLLQNLNDPEGIIHLTSDIIDMATTLVTASHPGSLKHIAAKHETLIALMLQVVAQAKLLEVWDIEPLPNLEVCQRMSNNDQDYLLSFWIIKNREKIMRTRDSRIQ